MTPFLKPFEVWHSLKTRITLFTLAIFLLSFWTLSFYVSQVIRETLEKQAQEQQFSVATLLASEINDQLTERLRALESVASNISEQELQSTNWLTGDLMAHQIFVALFNAGVYVTDAQGVAVASLPPEARRLGVNYGDRDYIAQALNAGRTTVGKPVIGRALNVPIIGMATPIRDAKGRVIGALAGVTSLDQPNFLDKVRTNRYGVKGGYLLIAKDHRMVVTATDKRRIMTQTAAPGVSALNDRFLDGFEGSGVNVNVLGEEVLVSAKGIPAANWFLSVNTPTSEAFAALRLAQQRMLWATSLLTMLAVALTWWILGRELAPLLEASRLLGKQTQGQVPAEPLPVHRQDEIGKLITAFNGQLQALTDREQRLMRVVEGSNQGFWDWNMVTNVFEVSARWETMLGYAPGEMNVSVENWANLVHPDDMPRALESIRRHLAGETPGHEVEFRARCKDGQWRWILTRGRIVSRNEDGTPLMMAGTHTDIAERKAFELGQREAATVFSSSYEGIMVVGPDRRIIRVNPAFTRITGYSQEEVQGRSPGMLSSGQHDADFYAAIWQTIQESDLWRGEVWNRRKNGEMYAEQLSISVVRDDAGAIQYYLGVFSDISQFKAHEAELNRIAHYDLLTGSPNRRLLADRLDQAISRATRTGRSLVVGSLDLDGFKAVNDRHGHAAGDQLLIGVTENLKQVLRGEDTLARLGGDEFVLLLDDVTSPEECSQVLDRVLDAVRQPVRIDDDGTTVTVSASIGVSIYPDDPVDADTLLRHADQAMYLAKDAGKNRYHLFDRESDRKAQVHRQYLEVLRRALVQQEFVLYYQPKVNLLTGEIVGAEALVRWQHPDRGLLAPAEFLPHINGSDLEKPLGEWVIDTALRQTALWQAQGLDVSVSVNVSANHLLQHDFFEFLRSALLRQPSVSPERFELEVLETAAIADMEQAIAILQHCRALGVNFALDDFGTGYSSLTYLRKLPVDMLKIDQSFVRDMLTDPEDMGIVEGVIRLAGAFNRKVIAEGVENLDVGAALVALGCNLVQGYGIARPMPAADFMAWTANWQAAQPWKKLGGVV